MKGETGSGAGTGFFGSTSLSGPFSRAVLRLIVVIMVSVC